jgi:hypothetical protein
VKKSGKLKYELQTDFCIMVVTFFLHSFYKQLVICSTQRTIINQNSRMKLASTKGEELTVCYISEVFCTLPMHFDFSQFLFYVWEHTNKRTKKHHRLIPRTYVNEKKIVCFGDENALNHISSTFHK